MDTILFPTDFSEVANNAFEYALELADHFDTKIVLLHSFHYTTSENLYVPDEFMQALKLEEEDSAMDSFKEYEQKIQERLGKEVEIEHIVRYGFPADEILKAIKEVEPEIVVMGTKGTSNVLGNMLGSVCSAVIENGDVPVLAVPDEAKYSGITHITYASNFENEDIEILHGLMDFARKFEAKLACVHVKTDDNYWDKVQLEFFNKIYQLELQHNEFDFFILNHEEVEQGLNEFVKSNESDILTTLTHHRGIFQKIFNPSLTRKLALHTHTPLLVFHK